MKKIKKYGVYCYGILMDTFSDELVADEYARLTRLGWRKEVEVKPVYLRR